MRTIHCVLPACAALCLLACGDKQRPEGPTEALVPTYLEATGLTVGIPLEADVRAAGDREWVVIGSGTRHPLSIDLGPHRATEASPVEAVARALPNGATVRYVTRSLGAAGSGGAEAELQGTLTIGRAVFAFRCHHRAEWPAHPAPERCLRYLGTAYLERGR